MNGNIAEPVCIIHICGVTAISNPCESVDYACKFSCLQTDGLLLCVFLSSATKCESLPLCTVVFRETSVVFKSCSLLRRAVDFDSTSDLTTKTQ